MSRYIEANTLIRDIEQSRANNNHNNAIASQTHNAEHRHFIKMVLDQPTADGVEVVRCRDCNYYKLWDGIQYGRRTVKECCRGIHRKVNEDDYCSYGERRENDNT